MLNIVVTVLRILRVQAKTLLIRSSNMIAAMEH
jgi:hypothetical protein